MNLRYTHEDKTYDVALLTPEAQATFSLLHTVQNKVDAIQSEITIAQAASVALHQRMQELLDDAAVVEDDEPEE